MRGASLRFGGGQARHHHTRCLVLQRRFIEVDDVDFVRDDPGLGQEFQAAGLALARTSGGREMSGGVTSPP